MRLICWCLRYFDPEKELIRQVDSSKDVLGTSLLQEGKPIEYSLRALTSAERNWAQIEKETLAVVFGLECFDQYTYGRKLENGQKPLAAILKKSLSQASKGLQELNCDFVDVIFSSSASNEASFLLLTL